MLNVEEYVPFLEVLLTNCGTIDIIIRHLAEQTVMEMAISGGI